VFGILWRRPNTKGVYACIVCGVIGGFLFKNVLGMSWEGATIAQVAVCFVGFFGGALFGTAEPERKSRDGLFREIEGL